MKSSQKEDEDIQVWKINAAKTELKDYVEKFEDATDRLSLMVEETKHLHVEEQGGKLDDKEDKITNLMLWEIVLVN